MLIIFFIKNADNFFFIKNVDNLIDKVLYDYSHHCYCSLWLGSPALYTLHTGYLQ